MYSIEYRRSALKEIKKLDRAYRKEIVSHIENCAKRPYEAGFLKGDLSGYLSYNFNIKGTGYRIIYSVNEATKAITIEMVGPRDNIYKKLKKRL